MLLEWHNGREQSSWVSVQLRLSYDVTLNSRDADRPHTRYAHRPLGLHQSYTHCTQRTPTVRFCSPAGVCYIGPPTAMSNTLHNIQTDAKLTRSRGPPKQTTLTLRWGEEYAHRSDASHSPVIERILAEASAYYTRELVSSLSTAMKSRPAYCTRVCIIRKILRYVNVLHSAFFNWPNVIVKLLYIFALNTD